MIDENGEIIPRKLNKMNYKNKQPQIKEFKKVTTTDYYHSWDGIEEYEQINDDFKHDDKIEVRWNDGNITKENLVIKFGSGHRQVDMNLGYDTFETRKFYIIKKINDNKVSISLQGMYIRKCTDL